MVHMRVVELLQRSHKNVDCEILWDDSEGREEVILCRLHCILQALAQPSCLEQLSNWLPYCKEDKTIRAIGCEAFTSHFTDESLVALPRCVSHIMLEQYLMWKSPGYLVVQFWTVDKTLVAVKPITCLLDLFSSWLVKASEEESGLLWKILTTYP